MSNVFETEVGTSTFVEIYMMASSRRNFKPISDERKIMWHGQDFDFNGRWCQRTQFRVWRDWKQDWRDALKLKNRGNSSISFKVDCHLFFRGSPSVKKMTTLNNFSRFKCGSTSFLRFKHRLSVIYRLLICHRHVLRLPKRVCAE